jgi:nucleotide-binding universal stress UspA family protein
MNPPVESTSRVRRAPGQAPGPSPDAGGWKVLVAADGSPDARRAVGAAARLPWPAGSQVRVVTVVDNRSELPETIAAHRSHAEEALKAALATFAKNSRPATSAVLEGAPARAILEEARTWGATAIVVGARGLGKMAGLALGSVSAAVGRAAACHVLVIKKEVLPLRLLVAVDASEHGIAAATTLSRLRARGTPVTILRVIEPPSVRSLTLLPAAAANLVKSEIARAKRDLERDARAQVDDLAARFASAGWKPQPVVRAGVPLREIKSETARSRATLVCLGARGATGLERLLLGSVSEALLATPGLSLFIGR